MFKVINTVVFHQSLGKMCFLLNYKGGMNVRTCACMCVFIRLLSVCIQGSPGEKGNTGVSGAPGQRVIQGIPYILQLSFMNDTRSLFLTF